MKKMYGRWMHRWEDDLCSRATNRVARPFEWGLEWTSGWPVTRRMPRNGHDPHAYLKLLNAPRLKDSAEFFGYDPPSDFRFAATACSASPAPSKRRIRKTTASRRSGSRRRKSRAADAWPRWCCRTGTPRPRSTDALCVGLARLGISALRLSMPYHDYRMPTELERADYAVSSNVARTIDATRQAVIDTRSCVDWLVSQGFERIGLVGTSLGSCYAFLASVHDPRIEVNVFNHCSTYFADVVWEGLSSQHIRKSIESEVTLEQLRDAWMAISPPELHRALRADEEEASVHLRALRHHLSGAIFRAGDREGARAGLRS